MKEFIQASMLGLILLAASGCRTSHQGERAGFRELLDSVVRLDVWETSFNNGSKATLKGVGSGVIMTETGYILTNAHVVNPYAERISVTLNNLERVPAALVGWDHWTDLAVVKLDLDDVRARGLTFTHARFGDSDGLEPGDFVFAVGTPNGLTRTVTRGIISNTNRFFEGSFVGRGYETGYFNTWLQTDAAINPGNSGGPLVNEQGTVIGINTRSYLGANNLSFAVPANIARGVMGGLIEAGEIERSYVGLVPGPLQDLEDFYDLEVNRGMLIQSIDPGSPASRMDLRPGDIMLRIDGQPVDGRFPEQLPAIRNLVVSRAVGSAVTFAIKRRDKQFDVTLITEKLQSRVGEEFAFEDWGLSVQKISRTIARERQLDSHDGVMVIGAQSAFPAREAGIISGDIIVKVNQQKLENMGQLKQAYAAFAADPQRVLLEVVRNHQVSLHIMKP